MKKLIIILAFLLSSTSIYTQDREQMRQMVSEYMKKIGIEDDQIQTSMMLVRKIMMEYVNEMEISKESSEKLKNYSDKQRQALKDLAKKLIKLRSENRSKSNFDKPNKRQGPARPDVGDPIFEKIVEYFASSISNFSGTSLAAQNLNEMKKANIFTQDGRTVIALDLNFDRAWSAVSRALTAAEIVTNDRDRSSGIFFVSYAKEEDRGLFGLFGGRSDINSPEVVFGEESQFEITITQENDKSYVRAISKDGNIEESEQLLSKINESLS